MDFEDQVDLEHLLFLDRRCRTCGQVKNLIEDYYQTRNKKGLPSSYSYECKGCTIKRVVANRMTSKVFDKWEYPDW